MSFEKLLLILGSLFIILELVLIAVSLYLYMSLLNTPAPPFPLPLKIWFGFGAREGIWTLKPLGHSLLKTACLPISPLWLKVSNSVSSILQFLLKKRKARDSVKNLGLNKNYSTQRFTFYLSGYFYFRIRAGWGIRECGIYKTTRDKTPSVQFLFHQTSLLRKNNPEQLHSSS